MIPRPGRALTDIAGRIAMRLAPVMPTPYDATDAGLISMLLTILGGEADSGIERRMADGAELADLFRSAEHAPGAKERRQFIDSRPSSQTHGDVSTWLDEGLALLIELHNWAETTDNDLNDRIWEFLYRHTERHKIDL